VSLGLMFLVVWSTWRWIADTLPGLCMWRRNRRWRSERVAI